MTFTILNASAGSGKTHRITGDLSAKLRGASTGTDTGPGTCAADAAGMTGEAVLPEQVIATTFTVRAAADLQAKARERLLDDAAQAGTASLAKAREDASGTEAHATQVARQIGSALIGTIHSVAGRIVSEYAIDEGLSPRLRVLDEDEQKRVFTAAADVVITDAVSANRDLLARTHHNGEPSTNGKTNLYGPKDWPEIVNWIGELVRDNRMSPEQLDDFAAASWAEYRACLPPADGADRRSAWAANFAMHLRDLQDLIRPFKDLEGEEQKSAAKAQGVRATSINGLIDKEKALRDAFAVAESGRDSYSWYDWYKLGTLSPGRASKPVEQIFTGTTEMIASELPANPAFQADIEALIRLTFATAKRALGEYESYKRELGVMDFVDQQVLALRLLETRPRVRESIASRFKVLAVDEFQDTSPIQLALFLKLAELVDDVTWVGDPKQAIYRFRGADPELMDAVTRAAKRGDSVLGTTVTDRLSESWRSSQAPLDLSNTLFGALFEDTELDDILLTIPEKRRPKAGLGSAQAWFPHVEPGEDGKKPRHNQEFVFNAIAAGIDELLGQELDGKPIAPSDVAVLTRSNDAVSKVIAALTARGIPAAGGAGSLLAGREAQLLMAGLKAVVWPSDTLALTELAQLIPEHRAHDSWLQDLAACGADAPTPAEARRLRRELIRSWWEDPSLGALQRLRETAEGLAPVALVDAVIEALELHRRAKMWSNYEKRLSTLDAFRALAQTYADRGSQTGEFVGPHGLVRFLAVEAASHSGNAQADAVTVMTVHGSKGLQWPVVVTALASSAEVGGRPTHFVRSADRVDLERPLAGRSVYFLPQVVGAKCSVEQALNGDAGGAASGGMTADGATDSIAGASDLATVGSARTGSALPTRLIADERAASIREAGRVNYVALTRAKYISVIAPLSGTGNHALNEIASDDRLMEWCGIGEADSFVRVTTNEGRANDLGARLGLDLLDATVDGRQAVKLPMPLRYLPGELPENFVAPQPARSALVADDLTAAVTPTEFPPARFQASGVPSAGVRADVRVVAELGEPLVKGGGQHWDMVGEAVHAYLATPHRALDSAVRRRVAERLISTWEVGQHVRAEQLLEVGERWSDWLDLQIPGGVERTEVPIAWANESDQEMEGWIDSLVELPTGELVLIDHKTYPGADPVGHIREHYLGQLATYSAALRDATGNEPAQIYIHLPLLGKVVQVVVR